MMSTTGRRKRKPSLPALMAVPFRVLAPVTLPAWFGHIRYGTPIVHSDDHRDLAKQAVDFLLREGVVARQSRLARNRHEIERSCGFLDVMESEVGGKVPGRLKWDYSHVYDPLARRGIDDNKFISAYDEFSDFWERSLIHMRIDSERKSYQFLGFCCHLLQDMAVPSHTYCIPHGLRTRTADNLELVSRSRRFYLRVPTGEPYAGEKDMHLKLFIAMGIESRGREAYDLDEENEMAPLLRKYYMEPKWTKAGWQGRYVGEPYYPCHRLLPSTPRIELVDLVTLRNYLMPRAAERTAQLIEHFAELTGTGD